MDILLYQITYTIGSIIAIVVNIAVLVAAIFAPRKIRLSVALIALGCVLSLAGTIGSYFLHSFFSTHPARWIGLALQALFMLHNILWAAGTILLLMEAKTDPVPPAPPL